MNTNLTQVIIETIEQSKAALGSGLELAKEQTPLVVNEFLVWSFWEHAITCFVILSFILALVWPMVKWWRYCIKQMIEDADEFPIIIFAVIPTFVICYFAYCGFSNGLDAVKIKLAPRVYLIEYVAKTITK